MAKSLFFRNWLVLAVLLVPTLTTAQEVTEAVDSIKVDPNGRRTFLSMTSKNMSGLIFVITQSTLSYRRMERRASTTWSCTKISRK